MTTTLATLFAEGQRIPELDEVDFRELVELVDEERERRGMKPVVVVVRHPDYATEVHVEGIDAEVISIDHGSSYDITHMDRYAVDAAREQVAHLAGLAEKWPQAAEVLRQEVENVREAITGAGFDVDGD